MRAAIVIALAVHAVLIVWLAPTAEPAVPVATTPAPPPPDPLVEVVLLDEPAPKPVVPVPVARATTGTSRHASTAAPHVAVAPAAPPVEVTAPLLPQVDYFTMRGPDPSPTQVVDVSPAQVVDHAQPGESVTAPADTGELRPAANGTYTTDLGGSDWHDRTATAHVARDGTVTFENAPDFDIHFAGLGFAGKFNVDDWIMRKHGIDPYASAKREYLDRTREQRAQIAEVYRADALAHATQAMQRNVDVARAIADPQARKEALFELWDDVAETGDEKLVQAGADARAYLVGAIRAMRPTLEFTADELARLNAQRHSSAVFAPYEE